MRYDTAPDRDTDNALSIDPNDRDTQADPLIAPEQADAIVSAIFKWVYDTPVTHRDDLSTVACIVCDAVHADITLQPLHDAYAREKAKRGIK